MILKLSKIAVITTHLLPFAQAYDLPDPLIQAYVRNITDNSIRIKAITPEVEALKNEHRKLQRKNNRFMQFEYKIKGTIKSLNTTNEIAEKALQRYLSMTDSLKDFSNFITQTLAPEFRNESNKAISWLNQLTTKGKKHSRKKCSYTEIKEWLQRKNDEFLYTPEGIQNYKTRLGPILEKLEEELKERRNSQKITEALLENNLLNIQSTIDFCEKSLQLLQNNRDFLKNRLHQIYTDITLDS